MIRKPNNWNEVQEFTDRQTLPLGAYVCKTRKAVIQANEYGEQLCVLFDIAEGEFKGFFDHEYQNNTNATKKWKGVLRVWLPKEDGSDKDEWTKSTLKGMTTAFEKSNYGYQWDWNEESLGGKMVGILFRKEEWEYDGKTGWAVRPFRAISVDKVRSGDFTLPNDKPLKKPSNATPEPSYSSAGSSLDSLQQFSNVQFTNMSSDDGELPF